MAPISQNISSVSARRCTVSSAARRHSTPPGSTISTPQDADRVGIGGVFEAFEADGDVALGRQIVDFGGTDLLHQLRGETFVTRKITRAIARIELGLEQTLYLGNLDAKRDWGHARDYVEGMWRILQQDTPDDYVLATGETRSVREFVETALAEVGRRIEWSGQGVDEIGIDPDSKRVLVRVDPMYFRPTEVDLLIGDAGKAQRQLDWKPKTSFSELVKEMVASDLALAKRDVVAGGERSLRAAE